MLHVAVPAAGKGQRFIEAGYPPKPHVLVDGVPMLRRVVDNLRPTVPHRTTVVVTAEPPALPGVTVKLVGATSGAVETILHAEVEHTDPLLVGNCDQLLGFPSDDLLGDADVTIATFTADKPAHSYVQLDQGRVVRIAEKQVISEVAVAGVYHFARGSDFAAAAKQVLADDRRVLGEFYVSTVLDELLGQGAEIRTVHGEVATLGTPEELRAYEAR